MRVVLSVLMVIAASLIPALASNPGEPLDCSDWVLVEPGLSCNTEIPYPCKHPVTQQILEACLNGGGNAFSNEGDIFFEAVENGSAACGSQPLRTIKVFRTGPNGSESLVAYLPHRCVSTDPGNKDEAGIETVSFDTVNGRLVILAYVYSVGFNGGVQMYEGGWQRISINGFTTLFDVLQTFEPSPISYRVPYMPEGFPAASYFDTYYGDLATVGDWSKAQSLRCGYPTTPPHVGDYLTVTDPLPDPSVNTGRYYVTAVNYMGQTRYGRKSNGGVLSGRDPALLPACE